jgi:RNA polymerase sigma factor (sigma-70 family)
MDDVPFRAAERSSSAYLVGATGSNTDEKKGEARGIHGVLRDFAGIFDDIAVGVRAAMPACVDPDEWEDVFQDIALEAVLMHAEDPECFGAGNPKHWASRTAKNRRLNNDRDESNRVIRDEAYLQLLATGVLEVKQPDAQYDERERDRAIERLFAGVNPRHRKAVEAYLIDGLTLRVAAAVGGVSERALKRALEKVRRDAPLTLGDWRPASTQKRRQGRAAAKPPTNRGTNDDQRS